MIPSAVLEALQKAQEHTPNHRPKRAKAKNRSGRKKEDRASNRQEQTGAGGALLRRRHEGRLRAGEERRGDNPYRTREERKGKDLPGQGSSEHKEREEPAQEGERLQEDAYQKLQPELGLSEQNLTIADSTKLGTSGRFSKRRQTRM